MRRVLPCSLPSLDSIAVPLVASSLLFITVGSVSAITTDLLLAPIGEAASDQLGYSTATAGDVNGDGFADVIAGAPNNDAGGGNAGRAYVYYGGPGADAVPDLTFTGPSGGYRLGASVGTAGDVNGDGFDDLVVGAPNAPLGGQAFVYFGGPGADALPDLSMTGTTIDDVFGTVVGTAGDVNGDGFDDVLVSAPYHHGGGIERGQVYVFFGGVAPDVPHRPTLRGESRYQRVFQVLGTAP